MERQFYLQSKYLFIFKILPKYAILKLKFFRLYRKFCYHFLAKIVIIFYNKNIIYFGETYEKDFILSIYIIIFILF